MTTISRDAVSRIPNRDLLERSASGDPVSDSASPAFDLLLTPAVLSLSRPPEVAERDTSKGKEPELADRRGAERRDVDRSSATTEPVRRAEDSFGMRRRERTVRSADETSAATTVSSTSTASDKSSEPSIVSEKDGASSEVAEVNEEELVAIGVVTPNAIVDSVESLESVEGEVELAGIAEPVGVESQNDEATLELVPVEIEELTRDEVAVEEFVEAVVNDVTATTGVTDLPLVNTAVAVTAVDHEIASAEVIAVEGEEALAPVDESVELVNVDKVRTVQGHPTAGIENIASRLNPARRRETSETLDVGKSDLESLASLADKVSEVGASVDGLPVELEQPETEEAEVTADADSSLRDRFLSAISEAFGLAPESRHAQDMPAPTELAAALPADSATVTDVRNEVPVVADSAVTAQVADVRPTGLAPNTVHHQEAGALRRAAAGNSHQGLSRAEHRRFLNRVGKAFEAAEERGGEIRLRLSPPRLGALKLEVRVEGDRLAARLETETEAARQLILEQLPTLRDRLAERGISIESFEVDLYRDAPSNGDDPRKDSSQGRDERQRPAGTTVETVAEAKRVECHLFGNGPSSRLDVKA